MDAYLASLEQIESWFFILANKKQLEYLSSLGVNIKPVYELAEITEEEVEEAEAEVEE